MAMDEEVLQLDRWSLQPQIPRVFLVDPESAAGQGVVAACVKMGTQNITLAQLSSEVTDVKLPLHTPVVLDEEFCISVKRPGGDSDTDADTDEVAVIVQFEGFVLPLEFSDSDDDEESEEEEEEGEDTANSEEDDGKIDEDHEGDEENN